MFELVSGRAERGTSRRAGNGIRQLHDGWSLLSAWYLLGVIAIAGFKMLDWVKARLKTAASMPSVVDTRSARFSAGGALVYLGYIRNKGAQL